MVLVERNSTAHISQISPLNLPNYQKLKVSIIENDKN